MSSTQSRASTTRGLSTTRDARGSSHPNNSSVHGNDPHPDNRINPTNPTILTICATSECLCSGILSNWRLPAVAPHTLVRGLNSVEPLIESIELALELLDTQSRLCLMLGHVILDHVQALLSRPAHARP